MGPGASIQGGGGCSGEVCLQGAGHLGVWARLVLAVEAGREVGIGSWLPVDTDRQGQVRLLCCLKRGS